MQSVNGPCKVLTFEQYQALDREGNSGEADKVAAAVDGSTAPAVAPEDEVFYWREEYDSKRKIIKVGEVPSRLWPPPGDRADRERGDGTGVGLGLGVGMGLVGTGLGAAGNGNRLSCIFWGAWCLEPCFALDFAHGHRKSRPSSRCTARASSRRTPTAR